MVIQLDGGTEIYSIVTHEAVTEPGLAPGVGATAVIKASPIILGVPA
jgi:molybdate transport system regulatory protein